MKPFGYIASGALVVMALALGTPEVWAQARPHGGGGGGGGRPSGGGGGGTAVSRGSGGGGSHSSGGSGGTHTSGSSGGARVAGSGSTSSGGSGTAVERGGSRANYGHPVVGGATNRTTPYYGRHGRYSYYPYDPYYLYGYGAFGLGAFYYDPFWWGYPYGYGYYGYPYGYGYYGGGYGYGYDPQDVDGVKGGLKLKVSPREAEVYVDGYFVGSVDDYDGAFQRLNLVAGTHRIEIRARGYEPLSFEVKIEPRETITYRGDLQLQQAR